VDFTVAQQVAAGLREGESVDVLAPGALAPTQAKIIAIDARVDPTTRNAMVRARIERAADAPSPGASVRVLVQTGPLRKAVAIPVSALRKGPGGDQVFVIEMDKQGQTRAYARQVESGAMLGDEVVTYAGVNTGERVAASGSFKLRDGVLVAVAGDREGHYEGGQQQTQALSQH
jgi:membrane fusion protein (multidrug efflux system)